MKNVFLKRLLPICICLCLCLGTVVVLADDAVSGSCGSGVSWSYDASSGELVISGNGAITDFENVVMIPWKEYCSDIRSITVEEGVTGIGDYALSWCENVTEITLPSTVTRLGRDAFGWCYSLRNITLPEGLRTIENEAFVWCSALTAVDIPASVNEIGHSAFLSCGALENINVADANARYSDINGVLCETAGGTLVCYPLGKTDTSYTVPSGITKIGDWAFYGNSTLTSIEMPSVTDIGSQAFFTCRNLYEADLSGAVAIGELAFYRCDNMVNVTLPSVQTVGAEAFRNCTNLQLAAFYNDSVQIGEGAFDGADYLSIVGNYGSNANMYAAANGIPFNYFVNVVYNGSPVEFDPMAFVVNDSTTLVPMRSVFEMLNAAVSWDETTNTAIAQKDGVTVSIQIGSSVLLRNGTEVWLPESARLIADRTYVPLRAVSEAFGNTVEWINETNTANIY